MIRAAQSVATKRMMMERLHDETGAESPTKISATDAGLTDLNRCMQNLNDAIFPYYVRGFEGGYLEPINSLDCIRIKWRIEKLKKEPWADKKMYFPFEFLEIDLGKNEARIDYLPGSIFEFHESIDGRRRRPSNSKRADGSFFNLSTKEKKKTKQSDPQTYITYANLWKEKAGTELPSWNDIVGGLHEFHRDKIDECVQANSTTQKYLISEAYKESKEVFDFMLKCMEIQDPDEPIDPSLLQSCNNKLICFVLFVLSFEPPFYNELNLACMK